MTFKPMQTSRPLKGAEEVQRHLYVYPGVNAWASEKESVLLVSRHIGKTSEVWPVRAALSSGDKR